MFTLGVAFLSLIIALCISPLLIKKPAIEVLLFSILVTIFGFSIYQFNDGIGGLAIFGVILVLLGAIMGVTRFFLIGPLEGKYDDET